ncbi:hypothetical protein [uncultured Chryseobacterium sp.]|uniref:hypothetical protein n=1 Tax=uncultured Chryseobacterium sp. TaxID=259322 RepID=UPI0025F3E714|nr:hypothetical protein [uncultured Chryseobacterium sp.]
MKNLNTIKLSREDLKNIFGGTLHPALECYSNRECAHYGEALIMCPDGTSSMTNYTCMGGTCMMNTGICPSPEIGVPTATQP